MTRTDRRLPTGVVLRNYKSIAACDVSPAQLSFLVGPNQLEPDPGIFESKPEQLDLFVSKR